MVVNGLDEYISVKCKQCVKSVPICPKPGTRYVIDGCSFVSSVFKQTSWIFGGQWKEIKDVIETFVINLLGEGCDAIFVMPHWADALTPTDLKNIKTGLDFVSVNQRLPTALDFYQNPPCAYFVVAQVLKACRVEVICSISDFEFEVAAWAKIKGCNGIISENNEFVALKGVPLFRLSSLDFQQHTIDYIDRFLLTKNVGLREHHMPLLSCLLGNSLIPPEMLQAFHKKLQSGMQPSGLNPVLDIMPRICMYVRPQTTQYSMLARTALADENKTNFLQAIISRYNLSSVDDTWNPYQAPDDSSITYNSTQIYEEAVKKQLSCESIPFVYGVLTSYLYEQGVTLEHGPLTSSFNLYRPLRKSCYSIIMGNAASVTEKCIASSLTVETVSCEEFNMKGKPVKLERLQKTKRENLRWGTFVKCAKVTFNTNLARQLPPQYLGLCCILNYWWHSPLIHLAQWELHAFLAQAVSQYAADVASLKRVLVTIVNMRAINLALQLARGAEALLQIAAVTCLDPGPFMLHNYFDGKLFSFYYYLSDKGATVEKLCDEQPDRVEMFNFLKMVVQSDNLSIDEEEDEEADSEDERKTKGTGNVSIVPEYEAISDDDEDGVEVEPVTDDDELFDAAVTGVASKINDVSKTEPVAASMETEGTADLQNNNQNRLRTLDRKDSTNGAVGEMLKLQMTSPDAVVRSRFPSFPSVSEQTEQNVSETEPVKSVEDDPSVVKQLFPINGKETDKIGRTNNGHEGCVNTEPAPPGLEEIPPTLPTPNMKTTNSTELEFKPRIPLPPLPDPMPLYCDPLFGKGGGDVNTYTPPPVRYKRHSDKENRGSNQVGGQPVYSVVGPQGVVTATSENSVKRHKSEES
ncbi:hypothetical protein ACHWQZ_G007260 [Mnemiopsis leidyi]